MALSSHVKSRRARTGCLTCRQRHYKCDETHPRCERCRKSGLVCRWPPVSASKSANHSRNASQDMSFLAHFRGDSTALSGHQALAPAHPLSTREADLISYYISEFHSFSYQICAWTGLIALPRRSTLPSILQLDRPNDRKMTNWANYFLPHLSTGLANDPLSLALSAFTALRMRDLQNAFTFYSNTLHLLRKILGEKDAANMNNQEFLRVWATTLLLAEYEAQLGNQEVQSQHVEGATTLSFIAASRFALMPPAPRMSPPGSTQGNSPDSLLQNQLHDGLAGSTCPASNCSETSTESISIIESSPDFPPLFDESFQDVPRSERELPSYLAQLTQRLRHSSTINESLDLTWPVFESPPIERNALGGLLEQSAVCYSHVMPLVEEFYTHLSISPPVTPLDYHNLIVSFQTRVLAARASIADYCALLDSIPCSENEIVQSCAEDPTFPFSPVIVFSNPLMAQPTVIPHIFMMFLAPFISQEEHEASIRYISGVFAGFEMSKGLRLTSAFPDLYVASFWRRGPERDYFSVEAERRAGPFMVVLSKIWGTIDFLQASRGGVEVGRVEILGIALKEYREAQIQGLRLQHTRH